jgi:hypothetical protein
MQVNKQYILVEINKEKQQAKREKTEGGIYLSYLYVQMKRNLQQGPILQIGENAAKKYPFAEVGDIALFNHKVEADAMDGEEDWALLHKEYNPKYPNDRQMCNEHRLLDTTSGKMLFGVIKKDGSIVINPEFIFLSFEVDHFTKKEFKTELLIAGSSTEMWFDEGYIMGKLADLDDQRRSLEETMEGITDYKYLEDVHKEMGSIVKEQGKLSAFLHAVKLTKIKIEIISPITKKEFGVNIEAGDYLITDASLLYPLDVNGKNYFLIDQEFAMMFMKGNELHLS